MKKKPTAEELAKEEYVVANCPVITNDDFTIHWESTVYRAEKENQI